MQCSHAARTILNVSSCAPQTIAIVENLETR
jgi:hypothetical protein